MKKKKIIGIGALLLLMFGLSGCRIYPEKLNFTDFPQYSNLTMEIISIKVNWDNNDGNSIVFDITDKSSIKDIIDKLTDETKFLKAGSSMNDGNHGSITLKHADDSETKIMLSQIQYGDKKQFYDYENDSFYNLIKQIGQNLGKLD